MGRTPRTGRAPRAARSLPACLRHFLTPAVWKQAQKCMPARRKGARWGFHNLILVVLAMTWSLGDSTAERFEMARGIVAICRPKRRQPGRTHQGFQKALARLPLRPLVALASALRHRLAAVFGEALLEHGFIPLGCDGSRQECPRSDELLRRLPKAGKDDSAPTLWITALVHLTTGLLWSWRLGQGDASERAHLLPLLPTLPDRALVVTDAGYNGYDLTAALLAAGASFLIRMSSKVHLIVDRPIDPERFDQGRVRYWPRQAQKRGLPPLELRLIRVRGRRRVGGTKRRVDVWLLTDVPRERLSVTQAAWFYRLRWENEGLFRTYKRTLSKVRLVGRSVRAVHRETYGALLACQLLLAQGAWAVHRRHDAQGRPAVCSPRQAILVIRTELIAAIKLDRRAPYEERLVRCRRERRARTSGKEKRPWPRRTPHKPPRPPKLRTMDDKEKSLFSQLNALT
jgi:hypothetical protein